jgi:prepilin-type N-terminal cleavage/methylation domain-containing protein
MDARRHGSMRQLKGDERGMTLMELMIVLLILSVVSGAMFSLLFASLRAYWQGDVASQAQQGARISIDRMMRDLRQARRLINNVTESSVTFNTTCATPQVSFAMPHFASVGLSDGSSVFMEDPNASGTLPYDGSYVSYYLAATPNSAAPGSGPYLIRAAYDLVANTLTLANVATDVTALSFVASGGGCPGTATREFTVTVTGHQQATGQNVVSQTIITDDVTLRNQ